MLGLLCCPSSPNIGSVGTGQKGFVISVQEKCAAVVVVWGGMRSNDAAKKIVVVGTNDIVCNELWFVSWFA